MDERIISMWKDTETRREEQRQVGRNRRKNTVRAMGRNRERREGIESCTVKGARS
jgi:hypothetical protein